MKADPKPTPPVVRPEAPEADAATPHAHNERPSRPRKRGATLPTRFTPRFWADADRRVATVRRVEQLVERIKADTGCDSVQREILSERAAFLAVVLATSELEAIEKSTFDVAAYTQSTNALIGCLRALSLDKKAAAVGLRAYVEGKTG